jgi:hypothetical protein
MEAKKITLLKSAPFMLFLFLQATVYAFSPLTQAPFRQIANAAFATRISQQPVTVNECTGGTAVFTIEVEGAINPSYVWQKNGRAFLDNNNVSGTTTSTLTITNFTVNDAAAYSCYVIDLAGNLQSEVAYLNAGIVAENSSTTCSETETTISVEAVGENVQYQWYASGSANTNVNGTLIEGATQSTYAPPINQNGTFYYYAVVFPAGFSCASVVSRPIAVNIGNTSAGRASANVIVCPNGSGTVSLTGSFGEIQWQQSPDGVDGWVNVSGGMGANSPIYITPALTAPAYYRAVVGNLTCGVVYSDVIAATIAETYVWTGSESSNWFDNGNWACNIVPTLSESVTISGIAGVQPVVESGVASAKSITILDGASLTVNTGATLHIQNNVTVDEGGELLVLNNAALIQDSDATNSGLVNVIKNGNPLYRLDYTMWSAPVTGQQLLAFSPATLQSRFYEYAYNAAQQAEYYQLTSPTGTFTAAKGYLIRMPDTDSLEGYAAGEASISYAGTFIGSLNNGEITIPASVDGNRFTAVGNPYPSPISINAFYAANENTLQPGSAIYLWRKRNNAEAPSYATVSKAGYVANTAEGGGAEQAGFYTETSGDWILSQGQGFLVKTAEAPIVPNITFNNAMRRNASANGSQPFFRQGQNAMSRLWINMTGAQGEFSQTAIAYIDGATLGMDYGYDGQMINDSAPVSLYSISADVNLAIQARPAFTDNDVVTMGFIADRAGTYTLSLDHADGTFIQGQKAYVKDNFTGAITNLEDGYTFTTEAGTFNNRFEVVYTTQALSTNNPSLVANNVIIYKDGSSLNINSGTAQMKDITIYDVRGRALYNNTGVGATQTSITGINAQQEVLIVEVNTDRGTISKKVVF